MGVALLVGAVFIFGHGLQSAAAADAWLSVLVKCGHKMIKPRKVVLERDLCSAPG